MERVGGVSRGVADGLWAGGPGWFEQTNEWKRADRVPSAHIGLLRGRVAERLMQEVCRAVSLTWPPG